MPELPDITVYIEALERRAVGATLTAVRLGTPFVLRTAEPPLAEAHGRRVRAFSRVGKRIAIELEGGLWLVIHLMIAGRLQWSDRPPSIKTRRALAAFDFDTGSLLLTEAGTKRRASLHVVDRAALDVLDPGGLEVLEATPAQFRARLTQANHTLKRALTDPRLFSGIGNAYSDEILHRARLSPVQLTQKLDDAAIQRLFEAIVATLEAWTERLRQETGDGFPAKVTAFRPEMAVHGKFREPCPICDTAVQRIRYASNETNYCPRCQTGGKLLADRSLSRLLRKDWPKSIDDLE
ncbi:MAG: DNA-formamidopyrimidine glycosylase family protein [Pseudomonadota bacterium]